MKYTGWCENDFNVYALSQPQAERRRANPSEREGGLLGAHARLAIVAVGESFITC